MEDKKEYNFGELEVENFEVEEDESSSLLLKAYARIPADCSDSMPADFCMAP